MFLAQLLASVTFYTPWKYQITKGFLVLSWVYHGKTDQIWVYSFEFSVPVMKKPSLIFNSNFNFNCKRTWVQIGHIPLCNFPEMFWAHHLAGIYLLKFNNETTRTVSEIYSKLTIKTSERRQWHLSGVFIVNFEQIVLVFLYLTLNK